MRKTPEQVCVDIIKHLRKVLTVPVHSIEAGGSVPLGTYVGVPDIDIFILTKSIRGTMRDLRLYFPQGMIKEGELDIWYVPRIMGHEVDFVVLDPDHIKIQTLDHTRYYMNIMNEELRDRIRYWKRFFKRINMYGAEVGGMTGICITRLAELYPNKKQLMHTLIDNLFNKVFIVDDPTLAGRDLLASMTKQKRINLAYLSTIYGYDPEQYPDIDLQYFFDNYPDVYEIRRMRRMGTDREYQFVSKCVRKGWGEVRHRIKSWNPVMAFDTLVTPMSIYIGIKIIPREIKDKVTIKIPVEVMSWKALLRLKEKHKVKITEDFVTFEKEPPFTSIIMEFQKALYNRLQDIYITVDKV